MDEPPRTPPVDEDRDSTTDPDMEMTIGEQLSELRRRLLIVALSVLFFSIIGFIFIDPIIVFLRQPLPKDLPLHQFSPTEGIFAFMKVAFTVGVVGALPVLLYQIGAYILPDLTRRERLYLYMLVLTSWFAFLVGMTFCYFVVLRFMLGFLVGAQSAVSDQVEIIVSVMSYVDFVVHLLLAYGLIFQTPTLICFFLAIGFVGTRRPSRWRPLATIIVAIIAAAIMYTILTSLADLVSILP